MDSSKPLNQFSIKILPMHIQIKSSTASLNAKVAETNFQKIRGHMFKLKTDPLFFEFNRESTFDSAVHMFFVFKALDLVYINSNWQIVFLITTRPVWTIVVALVAAFMSISTRIVMTVSWNSKTAPSSITPQPSWEGVYSTMITYRNSG